MQSPHHWSSSNQGASSASSNLPIWQEQALADIGLWGPNANLEVSLGGEPPVDPRLLAAVRMLYCHEPNDLAGTSMVQLGEWGRYLSPQNEVCCLSLYQLCYPVRLLQLHNGVAIYATCLASTV